MASEGNAEQVQEYVPEKVKKAERKLEDNPYDIEAWSVLIREAQNQVPDKARRILERLVNQFTNSGRYWKTYIEAEVTIFLHFFLFLISLPVLSLEGKAINAQCIKHCF